MSECTLRDLRNEYRPTMDKDILHSWAQDVVALLDAPDLCASGQQVRALNRAVGEDRKAGWTLPVGDLSAIKHHVYREDGEIVSLEAVEIIALEVERHILDALTPAPDAVVDNETPVCERQPDLSLTDETQAQTVCPRCGSLGGFGCYECTPTEAAQTEAETVLREIIESYHSQLGNYPEWFDRARKAVGLFDGDAGTPPAAPAPGIADAPQQPGPDTTDLSWAREICDDPEKLDAFMKAHPLPEQPAPDAVAEADAWRDVLAERQRQISVEGWDEIHDDMNDRSELAQAAACYALSGTPADEAVFIHGRWKDPRDLFWPHSWSKEWWKPTDRRRDLVKAGALILAEIERLDRIAKGTRP